MSRKRTWTKEMDDFLVLKKEWEGLSTKEVILEFDKKWPGLKTPASIQTRISKDLKISNNVIPKKKKPRKMDYTTDEIRLLKELGPGRTLHQVTVEFRKVYPERTESSVKTYLKKTLKFKSDQAALAEQQKGYGRKSWFIEGGSPSNKMNIGDISIRKDYRGHAYKWIKVRDGCRPTKYNFEPLHRVVWELENGPIPDNGIIMFKDGDSMNCTIENLLLCENERERRYAQPFMGISKEIAEAGWALAKLKNAIKKAEEEDTQ